MRKLLYISISILANISVAHAQEISPFDFPEQQITSSASESRTMKLEKNETVVDVAMASNRPEIAMIVNAPQGQQLKFWSVAAGQTSPLRSLTVPANITLSSVAWHPLSQSLFLLGSVGVEQKIYKTGIMKWDPTLIYSSTSPLQRLVVGPRPFLSSTPLAVTKDGFVQNYRVFFGIKKTDGTFATHTITENGTREYAVLDSKLHPTTFSDAELEVQPISIKAASALPEGFHPAGHLLVWQDKNTCFQRAAYAGDNWSDKVENIISAKPICGGNVAYTPNGMALTHWEKSKPGVELISDNGNKTELVAANVQFTAAPFVVPDGKGLIGITKDGNTQIVFYTPVNMPLADVVNAWMFVESQKDNSLLTENSGLFRALPEIDQLYNLYDTESYKCGGYDSTTPTRPYLVTTDIFWELYSAAFEGIFILSERQTAIPAFWQFVEKANADLTKNHTNTKMAKAFAALVEMHQGKITPGSEASKIMASNGVSVSLVTGKDFDFGNLKPRSHYLADVELQNFFRASKYLTDLKLEKEDVAVLKSLPQEARAAALAWINAYSPFIAPSRNSIVWEKDQPKPSYISSAAKGVEQLFPLSWGVDNEILYNTVYNRIQDKRLLPSGVDLAAVLGSDVANTILEESGQYAAYPSLKDQILSLKNRLGDSKAWLKPDDGLYQKWIGGLARQWSNEITSPGDVIQKKFWQHKRLQTGLASWTTLRHATVLVNERTAAECGEAGFEPIVLMPPRGYVEPDPKTFQAIADLFDATIDSVKKQGKQWNGIAPHDYGDQNEKNLRDGIIRRLTESRDQILAFRDIAFKEIANTPLTTKEYENILYVGRAAEHNLLIFKSLSKKDFALSTPDPITKVVDVAGTEGNLLLAGVGRPLEWDQIVPFFGRKALVKGSAYSYYEHVSPKTMTDKEWTDQVNTMARPDWITPYFSPTKLSCPAKAP